MNLRSSAHRLTLAGTAALAGWLSFGEPVLPAQSYSVESFALGGGGGKSTNSQFSVTGTVGQAAAGGGFKGGQFAVDAGFWSESIVVANPGAPLPSLMLIKASGALFFSWPLSANNYILEQSPVVGPAAVWTPVALPAQTGGQYRYLLVAPQPGRQFYRLRQDSFAP